MKNYKKEVSIVFSKHKSIERFTCVFLVLSVCMCILVSCMVVHKTRFDAEQLSTKSMYTTEVTMSRSETEGVVKNVLANKDQTKAFVLLKMNSMENLSIDANDYKLFVAGSDSNSNYAKLKSQPSGGIYVFGSSGYIGLYLVNYQKFDNQIISVIVRNTKDYSADGINVNADPLTIKNTFEKFDQMQIYFNPGAKGVKHAKFLESDKIDVESMYKEVISDPESKDIKKSLNEDLSQMFKLQNQISNYVSRLTSGRNGGKQMIIPDLPDALVGDKITAVTHDGEELKWGSNGWIGKDETNVDNVRNSDTYYLKLKSDYTFAGGYNFDWQNITFGDGKDWLKDIIGNSTLDDYISSQNKMASTSTDTSNLSLDLTWYSTNGDEFTIDAESEDGSVKSISQDILKLEDLWSQYYGLKYQYQVNDLKNIIYLQRDVQNVTSTYSDNFSDSAVKLY